MTDDPGAASTDARSYDTVTLLSDLGDADGFVGVLHSIVRQLAPGAGIVDLAHGVAPYDVRGASLLLARSIQYLCPGVIVAAVDPGAGSTQRAVALEVAGGAAVLIGPDNGVLAPGAGMLGGVDRAVVLDDPTYHLPTAATTFLARDVLAPAAAHLCAGVAFDALGSAVDPGSLMPGLVPLTSTDVTEDGRPQLAAEVLWVDRFGNAQLNAQPDELEGWGDRLELRVGATTRTAPLVTAFGALGPGEVGLLVDADGLVAVVADRSSAALDLGLGVGDEVLLAPLSADDVAPGIRTEVAITSRPPAGRSGEDA